MIDFCEDVSDAETIDFMDWYFELHFHCRMRFNEGIRHSKNWNRAIADQQRGRSIADQSGFSTNCRPKVFVKSDLLDCVDKNYVLLSTRSKLLANRCTLMDKAEEADIVMEIASGGVGTDRTELIVGTPQIPLGMMGSVPKINFYERKKAMGTAKLAILATDSKTKQPVLNSGFSLARSDHQHWSVMGSGPVLSGSVVDQLKEHTGSTESIIYLPSTPTEPSGQMASRSNTSSMTR